MTRDLCKRLAAVLTVAAVLVGASAASAAAQERTGTITGQVIEVETQRPLSGAQVFIAETSLGTITNSDGRYRIANVPAGETAVRIQLIGYGETERTVTVEAGATVTANFELSQEALGLDEIVVTGEAGAARRREVGNAISQLDMAKVQQAPANMEGLLQGQVAGLSITESAGSAGAGSQIRLRGNVSISMSNQPLIYIDGVRVRSDHYPQNVPPVGYQGRGANVTPSPLNDINPADIERIEVIKGAAAATLYGTEASAGVIQIFTKGGTSGEAQWTAQVDQGFAWVKPFGPESAPYLRLDPWLEGRPSFLGGGISEPLQAELNDMGLERGYPGTAHRQKYHLSVRGGAEEMNYFLSGAWSNNEGVLANDLEESVNLRGNFQFSPSDDLTMQWNTGLAMNGITNTPSGNNAQGVTLQAYRLNRNYVGGYLPERIDSILDYRINSDITHLTTGLTASYQPSLNFSNRFSVGYDRAADEMRQLRPFGFILAPDGIMSNRRWTAETTSFDYAGNYRFDVTDAIGSAVSWGGQAVETKESSVYGYAEQFPGPGEPTLTSGALSLSFEDRLRVINAGLFGQMRVDYQDRLFLTAGLRVDGNSAFGEGLGLQPYPKVSASYVISDEGWWPEDIGSLKLRGALGQSGRAPGAFDAVRTWQPVRLGTRPGFLPENLGNNELGPERTTEIEAGFDGSFLDDRLTAIFTYYHQRTRDALLPVRQIPSMGNWSSQLENVGELENRGIELTLNGSVVRSRDYGLDLGLSVYTNHSEMLDLGGAPEFSVGGDAWIIEGQPVPVVRGHRVTNPNEIAEPIIEEEYFFGPNQPTLILTPRAEFRFLGEFVLSAIGEYQGGFYVQDGGSANAIGRSVLWPYCDTPQGNASELIEEGNVSNLDARTRFLCNWSDTDDERFIFPADFFKLRSLSLKVPLGAIIPTGSSPTLTLSARNAFRWLNDDWFAFDPEMSGNSGAADFTRELTEHVPPASVFTASVRVNF